MSDVIQETVRIVDIDGRLAGELAYPAGGEQAACLLVNPHPYMGGTMDNNLIGAMSEALAGAGFVTLRFNYRGVQGSDGPAIDVSAAMTAFWQTGHAPQDELLRDDVRRAARWMRTEIGLPLAVVGYSFGAYASLAVLHEESPIATVLISPTLQQHDFAEWFTAPTPRLLIYGDSDFATPAGVTREWVSRAPSAVVCACLADADHFYRKREGEVINVVTRFLSESLCAQEASLWE